MYSSWARVLKEVAENFDLKKSHQHEMSHGYDMFSSQFVSNLRHDRVPYERYDYFHVFAEVKAEMKKATKYEVKIKINPSCKS